MGKNKRNRIIVFIRRQLSELRKGGAPVFLQKFQKIILILLAVPIVIIVRLLSPVLYVRFGSLYSHRIGHFALNTELYLCKRDSTAANRRYYDILCHTKPISNLQLKKMWDEYLSISKFSNLVPVIMKLNRLLPGYRNYEIELNKTRDIEHLFSRVPAHLSFAQEEESHGRRELDRLGVKEQSPFICFHSRDSAYLDALMPSGNWSYHDYRDCSIHNYLLAAEELSRRGYHLIRMGAKAKEPLRSDNKRIIDYANKYRTDFLDIYLSSKCRFFLACGSGIDEIAHIFRRPVVYVNFIPIGRVYSWNKDHITIPKKLWLKNEKRFLLFREILDSEIGGWLRSEQYAGAGIEVIENTPEEIKAVAIEMDERLKGSWEETNEDIELQKRFWSLFKPSELHGIMSARIGAEFLQQNKELLR